MIFSINGGISSSTARSGIISRKCRSLRAASKSSGMNRPRTWSSACASGPRRACARGVSSMRAPVRTSSGIADQVAQPLQRVARRRLRQPDPHRRAADIGFPQQRVERDQQIEVKRIQIHQDEYISYSLSIGRMARRKAMIGDQPINGETAMSAARQQETGATGLSPIPPTAAARPSPTTSPRTQAGS